MAESLPLADVFDALEILNEIRTCLNFSFRQVFFIILPHIRVKFGIMDTNKQEGGTDLSLAEHIEHTLLKPEATAAAIKKLCLEAKTYHLLGVCINPLPGCTELTGTPVKVVTVVGFPLGADACCKSCCGGTSCSGRRDEVDMVRTWARSKTVPGTG